MELKGSINCFTGCLSRVSYIRITGKESMYGVNEYKRMVGYYDKELFEKIAYAIINGFIDDNK